MKKYVLLLFFVTVINGAKILGVFNHPGASHTFLGQVLLKNMAKRGHEVVMISAFPLKEQIENYRDIVLTEHLKDLERRLANNLNKAMNLQELKNMTLQHTEETFTHPEVQQLLNSNQTFDLIVIDWFYNEATLIFGHIYKAPVIFISSFGNMLLLNDITGNVLPYSYVPGAGLYATDDLSFNHRVVMTLFNIFYVLYTPRKHNAHYEILKRHFDNPPAIEKLKENVALVLSNSHFSFETPRPYTPNIIPVGGFHVEEPKELPKDLKDFVDSAAEGFVYFSLGSQLQSSLFKRDTLADILKALSKLPQKVLWKFNYEDAISVPKNVKLIKWAPQTDILAHPNLKLFITHGGMLSLIESIHFHVPLLCIPFNGDQFTNAAFIESREIGLKIFPDNITEENFFKVIEEIIKNPKYQQQIKLRSSLLREQIAKPLDVAIYWTEHVLKYKETNYLKTFATKIPFYRYYLLDVIGFLLCLMIIVVTVAWYSMKWFTKSLKNLLRNKKTKIQ